MNADTTPPPPVLHAAPFDLEAIRTESEARCARLEAGLSASSPEAIDRLLRTETPRLDAILDLLDSVALYAEAVGEGSAAGTGRIPRPPEIDRVRALRRELAERGGRAMRELRLRHQAIEFREAVLAKVDAGLEADAFERIARALAEPTRLLEFAARFRPAAPEPSIPELRRDLRSLDRRLRGLLGRDADRGSLLGRVLAHLARTGRLNTRYLLTEQGDVRLERTGPRIDLGELARFGRLVREEIERTAPPRTGRRPEARKREFLRDWPQAREAAPELAVELSDELGAAVYEWCFGAAIEAVSFRRMRKKHRGA